MPLFDTICSRVLLLAMGCVLLAPIELIAQTPDDRDTLVIMRRDTVVVVKRDTVFFQQVNPTPEYSRSPADRTEELRKAREDRRQSLSDLRELRRQEYADWVAAQPVRRPKGISHAFKLYPTHAVRVDFPSVSFAVERTINGRLGLEGLLGFLTSPNEQWLGDDFRAFNTGRARFGLRGIRTGLGVRYYIGEPHNRFPFYFGLDLEYAIAPIELDLWVSNGNFEQRIDAPVNAQDFSLGGVIGWELRSEEKFVTDLATGLRVGLKGLYSSNEAVTQELDDTFWNLQTGTTTPYMVLVFRVGLGYGSWNTKPPSKKRNKSRR